MNLDIKAYVTSDIRHSPYLYSGLEILKSEGVVNSISIRPAGYYHRDRAVINNGCINRVNRPYPYSIKVKLYDRISKKQIIVGFDFQDWSNIYSLHCLKQCDIIFKKAFEKRIVLELEKNYEVRILPLGITQPTNNINPNYYYNIKLSKLLNRIIYSLLNPMKLYQFLTRKFKTNENNQLGSVRFENNNNIKIPPSYPYIFYQVEYYNWGEASEAHQINISRINLIRKLKNEFKNNFIGGIFYKYGELDGLSDCQTSYLSPESYKVILKNATIVISTNGFGESVPWKIAQYLKLGKCIISEEFVHGLPEPLIKGTHYETFHDIDECVKICKTLLENANKIRKLEQNACLYYEQNVEPNMLLKNRLQSCI